MNIAMETTLSNYNIATPGQNREKLSSHFLSGKDCFKAVVTKAVKEIEV